jgi:hypothetical protein
MKLPKGNASPRIPFHMEACLGHGIRVMSLSNDR